MDTKEVSPNILAIFCLISLISASGIMLGIIAIFLNLYFPSDILKSISVAGFGIFILLIIFLQLTSSAGITIKDFNVFEKWHTFFFFYFVVYPFANVWLFLCLNYFFNFVPVYNFFDQTFKEVIDNSLLEKFFFYPFVLYLLVIILGLFWRWTNRIIKNRQSSLFYGI